VELPKGRSGVTLDRPHTPRPQTDRLSIAQLRDLLPVPLAACEEARRLMLPPATDPMEVEGTCGARRHE
jgi:hypothetical protein